MDGVQTYGAGTTEGKIKPFEKKFVILEANKKILFRIFLMFWLIAVIFLFLRAFLEVLGADPRSLFAGFVYAISSILLLPFFGIFPHFNNTIQPGRAVLDAPALVAIVGYTVLVFLAVILIYILTRILKTERQVNETMQRERIVTPIDAGSKIQ